MHLAFVFGCDNPWLLMTRATVEGDCACYPPSVASGDRGQTDLLAAVTLGQLTVELGASFRESESMGRMPMATRTCSGHKVRIRSLCSRPKRSM